MTNILYKICQVPVITAIIVIPLSTIAQNKPNSQTGPVSATATGAPSAFTSGISANYIRTKEARAAVTSSSQFDTMGISKVWQTTQYFDGIGRPFQNIIKQGSPLQKDIVSMNTYDALGREQYKYLPYVDTGNNGNFKMSPFANQATFMASQFSGESVYYGQIIYENSTLNRPLKTMSAGNSWAGNNVGTSMQYLVNDINDSVHIWTIVNDTLTFSGNNASVNVPSGTDLYTPGSLSELHTIDENSNHVIEYKDFDGHLVLKKVQLDNSAGNGHSGWLCTYYVYDDLGHLRAVIPPKATEYLAANSWTLSSTLVNELIFRYEYDGRGRMIAKKVPGAGWTYMVYDKKDRLVFIQDAAMRLAGNWLYTLYDELSRQVQTGMMSGYTSVRSVLQAYVNASSGGTTIITNQGTSGTVIQADLVVNTWTTNTSYQATNSITIDTGFVSGDGVPDFVVEIVEAEVGSAGPNTIVSDNPLPAATLLPLTINFYDGYAFTTSKVYGTAHNSAIDSGGNVNADPMPAIATTRTMGLLTGIRVKVISAPAMLTSGELLESVNFYDEKGRVIQTQAVNFKNGVDTTILRYDFSNKLITSYNITVNPSAGITTRTKTNMLYDAAGRLLNVRKIINDNSVTSRYLARNSYDELGQLTQKRLGQKANSDTTAIEVLDNTFNIRGWLKGINMNYARGTGTNWFGMELNYDWGFSNAEYNGNIAGTKWRTRGDAEQRAYGFTYDAVSRLLKGDFTQYTSAAWNTSAGIDFSMQMGDGATAVSAYDANGNIIAMQQKGLKLNTSSHIDSLAYSYSSNSNKLLSVSDAIIGDNKMGDFTDKNTVGADYAYDDNGNLSKDKNKAIDTIIYNHLNLPFTISVNTHDAIRDTITYVYDALGTKLAKIVKETSPLKKTTTTYLGAGVFRNDTLQFLGHEEGRVRQVDSSYVYDYFIKDHLGNTRVLLTDEYKPWIYPAATLETGATETEDQFYAITTGGGSIVATPSGALSPGYQNNNGFQNPNTTSSTGSNSAKMYKLAGAGTGKTGLGITIKVMTGDTVSIMGKSFWTGATPNNSGHDLPVSTLLTALAGTGAVILGTHSAATSGALNGSTDIVNDVSNFLSTVPSPGSKPKAYINWILFDNQFRVVSSNSGFSQVGVANTVTTHAESVEISKNGYLYVYCSNESDSSVYFDNLQLVHSPGPLLEETHYYPFGLIMAGISSKAAGKLANSKGFNGIEHTTDLDLNQYDAFYRNADPQIGRWWQIDPKPNMTESPYAMMGNNPILFSDPLGDTARIQFRTGFLGLGKKQSVDYNNGSLTNKDGSAYTGKVKGFLKSAVAGLDRLSSGGTNGKNLVNDIVNSTSTVNITKGTNSFSAYDKDSKLSNVVRWDPSKTDGGPDASLNTNRPAFIGLGHELAHALDQIVDNKIDYSAWYTPTGATGAVPRAELFSTHIENLLRAENKFNLRAFYSLSQNAAGAFFGEGRVLMPGTRQNANTITANGLNLVNPTY